MEPRAGGAADPRGSRGGRGLPQQASPRARQLLARLDARPLAARAAADVAALVRRTGATLRLRPKAEFLVWQIQKTGKPVDIFGELEQSMVLETSLMNLGREWQRTMEPARE